jgi:hypothetical protein
MGTDREGATKKGVRLQAFPDAPARNRTWNLRIKSPLLCQLSYKGLALDCSVGPPHGEAAGYFSGVGVGAALWPDVRPACCLIPSSWPRSDSRMSGSVSWTAFLAARSPLRVWPAP